MEPDDVLVAPNTSATLPCLVDNKVQILHTDVKLCAKYNRENCKLLHIMFKTTTLSRSQLFTSIIFICTFSILIEW